MRTRSSYIGRRLNAHVAALCFITPCASLLACSGSNGRSNAADVDASTSATVGEDIDESSTRDLSSGYDLPPAFYAGLQALGVQAADLSFPDNGLERAVDPTRLHWTDTVRHGGTTAPTFGYMVAEDVEKALTNADSTLVARELLVAMETYGNTNDFRVSRYDRAVSVSTSAGALMSALQEYVEHSSVLDGPQPPPPAWEDVEADVRAQVAAFSPAAQIALAQAISGLLGAADLRDEAFTSRGRMTLQQWSTSATNYMNTEESTAAYTLAQSMNLALDDELLSRAGQLAVRSVESLRAALTKEALVSGARLEVSGPLGRIVVSMEPTDDTWSGDDYFLLVDASGNDTYLGNTASNTDFIYPVSVALDLAGNDVYKPKFEWDIVNYDPTTQGTSYQAAGLFGIAILDDGAGDDSYLCPRKCQGSGLFGVGLLIDHGGADTYRGYDKAQGAAEFGFGLLIDLGASADSYETWQRSQGFGGTHGIGWLVDDGGDDKYLAIDTPILSDWAGEHTNWSGSQGFGFGTRLDGGPWLSGGLGGLFDLDGNDSYECAVMCQGFGYFFGAGLFYDRHGDDHYVVNHKYGMGGATHQAIGIFIDGQGADTHTYAGHGLTAGGEGVGLGYDFSVGFHIDRGTEPDIYSFPVDIGPSGIMGYARHPALGVLINEGGDDEYHIAQGLGVRILGASEIYDTDRSQAAGSLTTPSVGMFLDLGGKNDVYDVPRRGVGNHATWIQTEALGAAWDPALDHAYGLDTE